MRENVFGNEVYGRETEVSVTLEARRVWARTGVFGEMGRKDEGHGN